jgi:hypothetical protein
MLKLTIDEIKQQLARAYVDIAVQAEDVEDMLFSKVYFGGIGYVHYPNNEVVDEYFENYLDLDVDDSSWPVVIAQVLDDDTKEVLFDVTQYNGEIRVTEL